MIGSLPLALALFGYQLSAEDVDVDLAHVLQLPVRGSLQLIMLAVALLGPGTPFLRSSVVAFLVLVGILGMRFGKREYLVRGQVPEDVPCARPLWLTIKHLSFSNGLVSIFWHLSIRSLAFRLDHEYIHDRLHGLWSILA